MFTKCIKTFKCVCHSCFKEAQSIPDLKQVKKSLCLARRDASGPVLSFLQLKVLLWMETVSVKKSRS